MSNLDNGVTRENNSSRWLPNARIVLAAWVITPATFPFASLSFTGLVSSIVGSLCRFAKFVLMKLLADAPVSVQQ